MNLTACIIVIYMLWQYCHAMSVGHYVKSCFLVMCVDVPVLSVHIPTVTDTFPFELICFQFLVNPVFVPVSSLPDFNFVSILKCKSENERGFISTSHVCFHP